MKEGRSFRQAKDEFNKSPYYRLLGMEVTEMMEGESKVRMPFKKELTHLNGILDGGAITSLANSSVTMALLSLVEPCDRIITIEFKINFLLPVSQGELASEAKIIHKNSQIAYGFAEVTNGDGELVARLVATFSIEKGN